jgi:hypothetical protein
MRKASTYIALCGLVAVCSTATATAIGTASRRQAHAANTSAKHTTPPKIGTIHMKLLARIAPKVPKYGFDKEGWLYTDGARWAAYESVLGTTRLLDTKSGHGYDRPDPEG